MAIKDKDGAYRNTLARTGDKKLAEEVRTQLWLKSKMDSLESNPAFGDQQGT